MVSSLLFGVVPVDPTSFGLAAVTLIAASFLAAWLPARRPGSILSWRSAVKTTDPASVRYVRRYVRRDRLLQACDPSGVVPRETQQRCEEAETAGSGAGRLRPVLNPLCHCTDCSQERGG